MGSDFHGARVGPGSIPDQVRALRHKHAPAFEALHGGSEQKSTVGLVLESTLEVKGVIPGGPMDQDFDGVRVEEGDVLLAIDGEPQSEETVYSQLVGDDVVGSLVRISIRKASTGHVVHLTVTRGSFSRIQAIGELFLLFKQMLGDMAYGTAVKSQDIVRAEGQARVVSRFASEHLARLHLHVRDLEELVSEQAKLLRARSQGHRAAVAAKIRERSRLVAIWHAWRNNYLEGKRRLRINRFILRCSNAQSLSVALSKWSHSHEEARRLRAQEQMHRSRAQNQALSATFAMWKHETRRGPCSRAKLEAFALRRRGEISAHVFVKWIQRRLNTRRLRTAAIRAQTKTFHRCKVEALFAWQSQAEFPKLQGMHHSHVEAQITRRHRRTRVAFAITGWQERVAEMKCVQRRAKTAMQRRRNRVLIFGLVTWRQRIRRLKRFRVAESRMTRHWQGQQLSILFSNWSFEAIDAKAMANITGKFARARCHLSIASAFECLIGSVLERKRLMCVSRKVMRHCNASAAYRAYAAWDAQVFQRKEKRRARSKTLVRLKRFQAGLALRRWRNHHWEVIFNSTIACKRLLHRKISWMEFVATVQRFTLSDCFHVWVKHVQSEGSRDRGQDKLSLAWSDFLDCVTQVRISRETAQKVVSGRMHELQQKILQTWRSLAHIRHRNLLQLSSWCMRRVLKREMSRAWRRWLEEMQRRRVMSTVAAKWVQKCMHAVLNMWKSRVGVRRALLHVLKIVFLGWKDHLQSQSKSNHSGRSARNIELSETLSVWISVHRKQMDKRQRAERLIQYSLDLFRRQNVLRLSASFSSWVSNLKGLRSVREIAQEALMCWDRVRVVTPAFISWKSTYQSAREAPMLSAAGTWWTNMQRNLAMLPRSHNAYEPARLISPKKEIGSTR